MPDTIVIPTLSLARREVVRFYRQPSRVVGALGTPLLFWFLIGSGLGNSYLEYFYVGSLTLVILFTSIFSTISLIEDRREGFFQSALVAPVSRVAIVAGKVLGGTLLSALQGVIFLTLAPFVGYPFSAMGLVLTLFNMALLAFTLTSFGFIFAWVIDSIQGFHAVMNLILIPMWFLSGALFPTETSPAWLRTVMALNPLTYGVETLRQSLRLDEGTSFGIFSTGIIAISGILFYVVAMLLMNRRPKESFA